MSGIQDLQLVDDYLAGDDESLRVLIERYTNLIFAFVSRYVRDEDSVEDVVQEVFIKMWKNLGNFDRTKSFKVWLYVIAKNTALDFLKKKRIINFSTVDDEKIFEIEDVRPLPDEILHSTNEAHILKTALKKLPANYSEILLFYYRDGFNFREISELIGKPLNTVKSLHFRALKMLKKLLSK